MSLRISIFLAALSTLATQAWAGNPTFKPSIGLPIHVVRQPPADLLTPEGQPLDPGRAISLGQSGTDLSRLEPTSGKLWQNRSYPPAPSEREDTPYDYPAPGGTVRYVRPEAKNDVTYMARVQSLSNPRLYYRFTLSRNTHSTLLRAALMRWLGYFVPSPRFYSNLTMRFSSLKEMDEFIEAAQTYLEVDLFKREWITERNDGKLTLTFSNATLEPALSEYFDAHWSFLPPATRQYMPLITELSRHRAYRALIVPLVLTDIEESINRFSPKVRTGIMNDQVVLTHSSARSLSAATYEDARWLVRKLARLSQRELRAIVSQARLPAEIDELVYRKLVYRIHNMMELFDVRAEGDLDRPPLAYDSASGLIKRGIITQERVPGYPQRFAHGERKRPFDQGDFQRYLKIEAITTLLKDLLGRINEKLVLQGPGDLAKERQEEIQKRVMEHIKTKPFEPLYQKVESWGGPIGSASLSASRHITTGTYYESNAAIQLVDDVTVGGSLGYFRALDGYSGFSPSAGGNISLLRNYTHVRPILSIKEGSKEKWQNLFVTKFMLDLAKILEKEPKPPGEPPKEGATATPSDELQQHPLDEFLSNLKEGEVFTITDSLAADAYLQNLSPLNVLGGFDPLNFVNTLSFGVDASLVVLRQTVFIRTASGLQVLIRGINNKSVGGQVDANFFLNLLRARASLTHSDIVTDAYVIEYLGGLPAEIADSPDADPELKDRIKRRKELQAALLLLFKKNQSELFESNFADRRFELDHTLNTSATNFKLFTERASGFSESHELKLRYPVNPELPDLDPADEEVTLYSFKKGNLVGRDLLATFFDIFEGLLKKPGYVARAGSPNPANVPFGKAYWRIVDVQRELRPPGPISPESPALKSPTGERDPSIGIIQHVWGGWHMKQADLLKLVDEISSEFAQSGLPNDLGSYRIIEPEFFATTQSLDYYRITQNTSIFQAGMDRVRDLMLQPDAQDAARIRYKGLFPKLFAALTRRGAKGNSWERTDPVFFREIMKVIGNGDAARGERIYAEACNAEQQARYNDYNPHPSSAWFYGNSYECLTSWMQDLMRIRRKFPADDRREQVKWMTGALDLLENHIELPSLLKFVGRENYSFSVRFNGFRTGDEDGDLEFISNTSGDPAKDFELAGGLFQLYANRTGIVPVEVDRSNGSFR